LAALTQAATPIYLAARYSRREEIAEFGRQIEPLGYRVTSRWLLGNHQAENDELHAGAAAEQFAREDLEDLAAAEILVAFSETPRTTMSRGGRHVEFGYALAAGHQIVLVGPREHVFCCLGEVRHFVGAGAAFDHLAALRARLAVVGAPERKDER
jgi:nucleoside 2-deoxyribosyltransferase